MTSVNKILGLKNQYEFKKHHINSYQINFVDINLARRRKNLKIHAIALRLGLSDSQVSRLFNGISGIKIEKMKVLCTMLDLNFNEIVRGRFVRYER